MKKTRTVVWARLLGIMFIVAGTSLIAGDQMIEKTFDFNQGGAVRVQVERLAVTVKRGSGDKVTMKADVPDRYELDYEHEGNRLLIKGKDTRQRRWGFSWGNDNGKIELTVPAECELQVSTSGGSVRAEGVSGSSHQFHTSGGSVHISEVIGELDVATSGGKITVKDSNGVKSLKTSGGSIVVEDSAGSVEAKTSGGGINMDGVSGRVEAKTSGGSITIRLDGDNEGVEARTSGGGIRVYGPEHLQAEIDARTSGGHVQCDYPVTVRGRMDDDKVNGTVNGGGALIKLNSSGGSIRISPR